MASALGTGQATVFGVVTRGAVRSHTIRTRAKHGKSTNEPETIRRSKAEARNKRATGRRGADVDGTAPTKLRKPLILLRGGREGADMKPGR
jgi:hypothetical protein